MVVVAFAANELNTESEPIERTGQGMLERTRDNEIHVELVEEPPAKSIAFGLERLGLIPMKAPILSCIILLGLIIGALFGIDRIKIDDSLSQLFRSNTKE